MLQRFFPRVENTDRQSLRFEIFFCGQKNRVIEPLRFCVLAGRETNWHFHGGAVHCPVGTMRCNFDACVQ